MILQYNIIHMIYTLYRTIHEYLQYTGTIWNFLHMIRYVSFDTENYANWFVPDAALTWAQIFTEEGNSTHDWAYELTKLKILTKILNKKENKALKIEIARTFIYTVEVLLYNLVIGDLHFPLNAFNIGSL